MELPKPESRNEQYLKNLTDNKTPLPEKAESRIETYLRYLCQNKSLVPGAGNHSIVQENEDTFYYTTTGTRLPMEKATATKEYASAIGAGTVASGYYSHAEGGPSVANGAYPIPLYAWGVNIGDEGRCYLTQPTVENGLEIYLYFSPGFEVIGRIGENAFEVGPENTIYYDGQYAGRVPEYDPSYYKVEKRTTASGKGSHAEGSGTTASGSSAHSEGYETIASGYAGHAEGYRSEATGDYAHSEGERAKARGPRAHSEGYASMSLGFGSHAENNANALSKYSHAEGSGTVAGVGSISPYIHDDMQPGEYTHAEGNGTWASGNSSHAEGYGAQATGDFAHAEGYRCEASGEGAHAEGRTGNASGKYSHTEGLNCKATKQYSHAGGAESEANGNTSFAYGASCNAVNQFSQAFGYATKTTNDCQMVVGKHNTQESSSDLFVVGCGGSASKQNCFSTGKENNQCYLKIGSTKITEAQLQSLLQLIS